MSDHDKRTTPEGAPTEAGQCEALVDPMPDRDGGYAPGMVLRRCDGEAAYVVPTPGGGQWFVCASCIERFQ